MRGGPARVFAAFDRSFYLETPAGIACVGGRGLGRGPLNAIVEEFESIPVGHSVVVELGQARHWKPSAPPGRQEVPEIEIPESIRGQAEAFLGWLGGADSPDDALIGLGPGLTPAGDDFVGGAMIALRAFGRQAQADRIARWALPLAETRTSRISRAHLACAAAGEGHEALHAYLDGFRRADLARLAQLGHSSGLDAAAGALLALRA